MRRSGLTVQFTAIGNGEVNTVMPRDVLLPIDRAYIAAPLSPRAENCRLLNAVAQQRYGYKSHGTTPASSAVTGLFQAHFDTNVVENLRSDGAGTYYLVGTTWTSIAAAGVGGFWTYAMVRRAGAGSGNPANQVLFSADGDADSIWRYRGGGVAATAVATGYKGARAIIGHRGRGLLLNVFDVGLNARKMTRVAYSIVGDPETYTGFGSGFVDLDDDPYPIVNARVIGGNVCVFKGNNIAGSITVGTLTGVTQAPYRWDVTSAEVGLLVPRSLISISDGLTFFLGHDGFYLYDGARGLARIAEGIARDIRSRMNPAALKSGFAWYKPVTGEIYVNLAMGGATTPNECWVFNLQERRIYGPYTFADVLTAACPFATTDTVTWDTAVGTWDSNPYTSWDAAGGLASSRGVLLGASVGTTWLDDEATLTDGAATIISTYTFAPIRASGRVLITPDGSQRPLEEDGYLTLRDITLSYRNTGAWTPTVQVSVDGGDTWIAITGSVAIGTGSMIDRTMTAPYTAPDGAISGTWFQLRVIGSTPMQLIGARMEFAYGGNARND